MTGARVFVGAAWALAVLLSAVLPAGCAEPGPPPAQQPAEQQPPEEQPPPDDFLPPPSSDALLRALRTDLCALLDEQVAAEHGWQLPADHAAGSAETLTVCAAATPDQKRAVRLSLDTAVPGEPAPAQGDRCTRTSILDPATRIAVKAQVRADGTDPCPPADRVVATAAQRFAAGVGQVDPPDPWISLDACALLPPLLDISGRALGGPKPTLREVRRLGARGCIATHAEGEVILSVAPAPGRAEDLDGDEVAVAGHPARRQDRSGLCLLRLVGNQAARQVQVITIEVQATGDRCAVATEMAHALVAALPRS